VPIYQYACRDCGKSFDLLRPIPHRDKEALCLGCVSGNTRRTLSSIVVRSQASPDPNQASPELSQAFPEPVRDHSVGEAGFDLIENVVIQGYTNGTAIQAHNARLRMRDVQLKNNKTGLDTRNSDIDPGNLSIE
jgi:putative FmdB family regulatory protein